MKNYLVIIFTLFFGSIYSQNNIDLKKQGLEYLSTVGKTDSALILLHKQNKISPKDNEVIGAIALGYFQKKEFKKAIKWAKKGIRKSQLTSPNGWIAGALSYNELKNYKKRDKWLEQGVKQYPTDYLLRYYLAKTLFPKNLKNAETELLNSIYLEPSFVESHLLLGEQMYQNGENLKALLPVAYFLVLYHDSYQSPDLVAVIENIFQDWSKIKQGNSKSHRDNAMKIDFQPQPITENEDKYEWIVSQFVKLLKEMENEEFIKVNPSWAFYLDFFSNISKQNFSEPLIRHILYSRYQGDTIDWLTKNGEQYKEMLNWIALFMN